MKPVFQTISHKSRGDRMRAVVASLLEWEIEQVPHFRIFDEDTWFKLFYALKMESHDSRREAVQQLGFDPDRLPSTW